MKRNSNRSYWLSNNLWYTIENGKFVLTSKAPLETKKSFVEWNKMPKITFKYIIRKIRAKFF